MGMQWVGLSEAGARQSYSQPTDKLTEPAGVPSDIRGVAYHTSRIYHDINEETKGKEAQVMTTKNYNPFQASF